MARWATLQRGMFISSTPSGSLSRHHTGPMTSHFIVEHDRAGSRESDDIHFDTLFDDGQGASIS
ncbi:MAG TPA: hypothetical protein EYG11_11335 [Candidatus Latescibacteria bacterium]|nr:hypothetical protein [Candidatus Handelsmanbacteria bacterium]HIL09288.1 hypothetical protein [Candidatus Latescibacterota bacterium]